MDIPEDLLNSLDPEAIDPEVALQLVAMPMSEMILVATGMVFESSFHHAHNMRTLYVTIARRIVQDPKFAEQLDIELLHVLTVVLECFEIEHLIIRNLVKPIASERTDMDNPQVRQAVEQFKTDRKEILGKILTQLREFKAEFGL